MRKTLHYEVTKDAILKEPQVVDSLTEEQHQVVDLFYMEGLDYDAIAKKLKLSETDVKRIIGAAKRKLYIRSLSLIANNSTQSLTAEPEKIWGGDTAMQDFLKEWIDVAVVMERLTTAPNQRLRDMSVRGIFDFCRKHRAALTAILEHPYTRRR